MSHLTMSQPPLEAAPESSYDEAHFANLFAVEDRHFWFQARNRVIGALVGQLAAPLPDGYRFLEIGCGTGNVLKMLEQVCSRGQVIGMDLFSEGLNYARRRVSSPLLQADVSAPPFNLQFPLIGLFDVLEHLPDEAHILAQIHRLLTPDGALVLTVPAYPSLWSYADDLAHHQRRYLRGGLVDLLEANGYTVEFTSYYMMSILPLVWLGRTVANARLGGDPQPDEIKHAMFQQELKVRPLVNDGLKAVLSQERHFIARRIPLPFGTSLIAVARRAE